MEDACPVLGLPGAGRRTIFVFRSFPSCCRQLAHRSRVAPACEQPAEARPRAPSNPAGFALATPQSR